MVTSLEPSAESVVMPAESKSASDLQSLMPRTIAAALKNCQAVNEELRSILLANVTNDTAYVLRAKVRLVVNLKVATKDL